MFSWQWQGVLRVSAEIPGEGVNSGGGLGLGGVDDGVEFRIH